MIPRPLQWNIPKLSRATPSSNPLEGSGVGVALPQVTVAVAVAGEPEAKYAEITSVPVVPSFVKKTSSGAPGTHISGVAENGQLMLMISDSPLSGPAVTSRTRE